MGFDLPFEILLMIVPHTPLIYTHSPLRTRRFSPFFHTSLCIMYICRCFVASVIPTCPVLRRVSCTPLSLSTIYLDMHLVRCAFGIGFLACCLKGSPQNMLPVLYGGNHRGGSGRSRSKIEHAKRGSKRARKRGGAVEGKEWS